MKYKNIRSMIHNWSHSFMSDMNYIDGGFVYEDVYAIARIKQGEKIIIPWIPSPTNENSEFSDRINKCIYFYRKGLSEHIIRHNINENSIAVFRTEIYLGKNLQSYVRAYLLDDRGKEYVSYVSI